MAFDGNKDGSGGFSVSLATIVNTIAALGFVALGSTVFWNNSEIGKMEERMANLAANMTRMSEDIGAIRHDVTSLQGLSQGFTDANGSQTYTNAMVHDELRDMHKQIDDLDRLLAPPRGNGH